MDAREFRTALRQRVEAEIGEETSHLLDQAERDFKDARGVGTFGRASRMKGMRRAIEIAEEIIQEAYGSPTGKA